MSSLDERPVYSVTSRRSKDAVQGRRGSGAVSQVVAIDWSSHVKRVAILIDIFTEV